MPHRPQAKIYQFPINRQAAETPTNEPDKLKALKEALSSSQPVKPEKPKRAPIKKAQTSAAPQPNTFYVDGNGIANLGTIGAIHYHSSEKPPKPIVIVQTGVGTINAQQKRQLLDWRDKVVEASAARVKPKTGGDVMGALNKYMKVNKYDEILAENFERALNWMKKQVGTMHSMKSAPKKIEGWRTNRIKAIHARSKEKEIIEWRIDYMQKKFGKTSLKDLDDKELDTVYRAVMTKKLPESAN